MLVLGVDAVVQRALLSIVIRERLAWMEVKESRMVAVDVEVEE